MVGVVVTFLAQLNQTKCQSRMTLAVKFSRRKRKSNIDTRLIGLKQNDRSTDNAVQKRRFKFETLIHLFSKKCFCTI